MLRPSWGRLPRGSILALLLSGGANLYAAPPSELETQYTQAREALLSDISDPAKSFAFVEAAIAVGDVRGAIAALQRILLVNPDLSNIKLELGLLYLRSDSPQVAEHYLRDVVADPTTPPDMRERANELLAESGGAQSPHRLFGTLDLAVRWESNANAAPEEVLFNGVPAVIANSSDKPGSDESVLAALSLHHRYDFGRQSGDSLDSNVSLFATQYDDTPSSNMLYAGFDTGPTLTLVEGLQPVSIRPYGGANVINLERARYRVSGLLGADVNAIVDSRTTAVVGVEARLHDYHDSSANPNAEDRSGNEWIASVRATREVRPGLFLTAQLFGSNYDADAAYESYWSIGAALAGSYLFTHPFDPQLGPAAVRLAAGYTRSDYDQPNPIIDPSTTQEDDRIDVRFGIEMPVRRDLSATFDVDYVDNDSTLENDKYDNLRVSLGIRYNFTVLP